MLTLRSYLHCNVKVLTLMLLLEIYLRSVLEKITEHDVININNGKDAKIFYFSYSNLRFNNIVITYVIFLNIFFFFLSLCCCKIGIDGLLNSSSMQES